MRHLLHHLCHFTFANRTLYHRRDWHSLSEDEMLNKNLSTSLLKIPIRLIIKYLHEYFQMSPPSIRMTSIATAF